MLKAKIETKQRIVTRELTKIEKAHGGHLEAKDVLEAAKSKKSPLHQYFEWDDAKAGEAHRLYQARLLIAMKIQLQSLRIAGTEPPKFREIPQRSLINLKPGRGYDPPSRILSSHADRQEYIHRLVDELRRWCDKVVGISELDGLREGVTSLLPPARMKQTAGLK
jgi:hypothetical protein